MRRWIVAIGLASVVLASAPARAQTALHFLRPAGACPPDCSGSLLTVDPDGPAVLASATVSIARSTSAPYATPDGRFVLWVGSSVASNGPQIVAIHDVVTRQTLPITLPPEALTFVGHPRRSEIFLWDANGPVAWSAGGQRRLGAPVCPSGYPTGTSGDGSRVAYVCNTGAQTFVADVDATTFVAMPGIGVGATLNGDGRDLYRVEGTMLRRYSVDTGTLLGEAAVPDSLGAPDAIGHIYVEYRTGRVFLVGSSVHAFDGLTLQHLRSVVSPWYIPPPTGSGSLVTWSFDPERSRFYAMTSQRVFVPRFYVTYAHWTIDTDTLAVVSRIPADPYTHSVLAPRPLPPVNLSSTTQGATVQLAWTAAASTAVTTRYVLEAGTAPGLSNVLPGLDLGGQTSVVANGVPPGRYYVRVRAGNHSGLSAPSNEVVVTVP